MNTEWSDRINQQRDTLSRTESDLLDFVNAQPERVAQITQRELAIAAGVSKPVIISLFRKLGYRTYRDFQTVFESFYATHIDSYVASEEMHNQVSTIAELVETAVAVDQRSLARMAAAIPDGFLEAFVEFVRTRRRFFVCGAGTGAYPAHYFAIRARRYRLDSYLVSQDRSHTVDELYPLASGDVVMLFHYADNDTWLYPILELSAHRKAKLIVVSGTIHPDIVSATDWFVHVPRGEVRFKNSMATPMAFSNLLLLSAEIALDTTLRNELKELEVTRRHWNT